MSFNAKDMTQGGQIASMRIRMFSQIANIMLYCLFIFFWILVGLVLWVKISWQTFVNGGIYWWCTTLEGMRNLIKSQPVYEIQYYGKTFRMNAAQVLHDKYMIWCGEQLWSAFVLATVVALVICLITFFVVSWILGRQGKQQSENEVTGGRQLTDNPKDVARMLKKDGKDSDIRIGDLPIIRDSEIQNFCLHGTVGAGKSEVIRRLANYARQRGDMVVIYDRSREFVKSYYDPSIDKILNPLDARCAAWDLWKECLTQTDFDNTANTLIPMGTKEDPFWQGSGRTIFAEAAYLMRNDPNRSYSKLVDTLLSIKIEKLRTFLRNSPAANLVEEKIEKTAISIRAVLTNYVKAIRYLQGIEHNGESFTIRDWMRGVREDQKNGWLFISSNADTHASLKPVISMWLSIAIRGLLAMGENRNRRVWFFCDELPTLHKLPDLVEILPEARKFGGCYVFGIQSYAQLEDIYGEKAAASLFDVMNTRAFFRSPSHKIAEFAAGEIGEKEHLKASEQYSYGADPVRDGVSTGKDMERQTLVSYSDIQSLPDLTCYVTLPGPYPAVKLSLKYQTRPKVAPEFIPRDINPEMENRLSAVLAAREAEGRQMASLFEPDVPEVVSGEDVTQAEQPQQPQQPQQPVSPAINDKKSDSGVNVPAGGIEQELKMKPEEEMEQQLPPGISESGEVVDMAAYEAWQQENHPDIQQQMQRREEVNINVHRERGEDVEPGDDF
ncbi:type IV conjugative transfer system coupling protein TraD [Escherichia coli]